MSKKFISFTLICSLLFTAARSYAWADLGKRGDFLRVPNSAGEDLSDEFGIKFKGEEEIIKLGLLGQKYYREGPWDKDEQVFKKIINKDKNNLQARFYLALIYSRQIKPDKDKGWVLRYDEAKHLLNEILALSPDNAQVKNLRDDITIREKALQEVRSYGYEKYIAPDGQGGFYIDTFGFPGTWEVNLLTKEKVENGSIVRLIKSLTAVCETQARENPALKELKCNGKIYLLDTLPSTQSSVLLRVVNNEIEVCLSYNFLELDRRSQREFLTKSFSENSWLGANLSIISEILEKKNSSPMELKITLISLDDVSNYGQMVLQESLSKLTAASGVKGIRISNLKVTDKDWQKNIDLPIGKSRDNILNYFIISLIDKDIEKAAWLINQIKNKMPKDIL